jgi:hypothetical protein
MIWIEPDAPEAVSGFRGVFNIRYKVEYQPPLVRVGAENPDCSK